MAKNRPLDLLLAIATKFIRLAKISAYNPTEPARIALIAVSGVAECVRLSKSKAVCKIATKYTAKAHYKRRLAKSVARIIAG